MPKLKMSYAEERDRIVRMVVSGSQIRQGVDTKDLAKRVRRSADCMRKKIKTPRLYTLEDLWHMATVLKWTDDEIIKVVRGRMP